MKRRRGSGEGLVRMRADGRWEGRIDLGWKDGKRERKGLYAKTRVELQEKIRKALIQRDNGIGPSRGASPMAASLQRAGRPRPPRVRVQREIYIVAD